MTDISLLTAVLFVVGAVLTVYLVVQLLVSAQGRTARRDARRRNQR